MNKTNTNAMIIRGIILIILGIIGIGTPLLMTVAGMLLFGILVTIAGVAQLLYAFNSQTIVAIIVNLFIAFLYFFLGITAIVNPLKISAMITLVIAFVFMGVGVLRFIKAIHLKGPGTGWLIFNSIIAIALGLMIMLEWPSSAIWVIGLFIAIELFFSGIASLVIAQKINQLQRQ